ncbi:MFS transporter [Undibacterium sp. CY18W]|uniref:MFS transporter n=1 Tax=Undibacterium hunanense TaxID=2762292 RepID=A0ABR6ZML0_9BURK|nr:MFS transporter [Undibacterium hunanense]MBC3917141.1 MFS transporter [Undibacterium hunanense]
MKKIGTPMAAGSLLTVLGGLYATQGLLSGLVHEGLPVLLRARGIGLDKIGLLSLLFLPSALKFLWASRIDRLTAGQPEQSLCWAGNFQLFLLIGVLILTLLPLESALSAIMLLLLVLMVASVTQDIVTDGMAVQALPVSQRGLGNSMQIGGSYLGYILGGGLLVTAVGYLGWETGIRALAVLVALCGLPALWLRRRRVMPVVPVVPVTTMTATTPSLKAAWRRPSIRWGMATIISCQASLRWFSAIMLTYLVDRGFAVVEIGILSGAGVAVAGVVGALLGGVLLKRYQRLSMLKASLIAYLVLQLTYLLIETLGWHAKPLLAAVFLLFCTTMSLGFVVLYTIMMDWASPAQAGTDYSLLQCTDAFCALVFGLSAGVVTSRLGYGVTFMITSGLAFTGLLLAPRMYARAAAGATAETASVSNTITGDGQAEENTVNNMLAEAGS